jgi:prolyl 4-hydroxylase
VSLFQNYTELGFKKIKTPESVFKLIKEFWDKNHENVKPEQWGIGNTYT